MSYIDGFVVPVPTGNREAYRLMAANAVSVFKECGATRVVECWGDDLRDGEQTDFKRAVRAEEGETVVFAWVEWPSKTVRDEASPKIMADPRMQPGEDMPFDGKRSLFGGFETILDE